MEMEVIGES